jgi:ornithine cyclodeaminase/alanine dehydrogenase-like protein (mu-crystallin family)
VLVLDQRSVAELLDLDALIDALGPALADLSAGRVELPARSAALMPGRQGFTGILDMPCYSPSAGALVTKVTSVFPENAGGPKPVRQAAMLVFDPEDGTPAALLDGTYITAIRTGACSALSVRLLARPDAATLAVLGTGVQARAHALAVSRVRPFAELRVAGRDPAKAAALATELGRELDVPVRAYEEYRSALDGADVVCATTFAVQPVVRRAWVAPGTHVTSVGYNPAGREVDDELVAAAALFVESRPAALHAVPPNLDIAQPIERGLVTPGHVRAELGEVYAGERPGRTDDEEITLYKSVGVAVQDAVAAALVLQAARDRGAGVDVTL